MKELAGKVKRLALVQEDASLDMAVAIGWLEHTQATLRAAAGRGHPRQGAHITLIQCFPKLH